MADRPIIARHVRIPGVINVGPVRRCGRKITLDCRYENPSMPNLWSPRTCERFIYNGGDGLVFILLFSLSSTVAVSTITLSYHYLEGVKVPLSLYQLPGGRSEIPTVIDSPVSPDCQLGGSYHVSYHSEFCWLRLSALGKPRLHRHKGLPMFLVCRSHFFFSARRFAPSY